MIVLKKLTQYIHLESLKMESLQMMSTTRGLVAFNRPSKCLPACPYPPLFLKILEFGSGSCPPTISVPAIRPLHISLNFHKDFILNTGPPEGKGAESIPLLGRHPSLGKQVQSSSYVTGGYCYSLQQKWDGS